MKIVVNKSTTTSWFIKMIYFFNEIVFNKLFFYFSKGIRIKGLIENLSIVFKFLIVDKLVLDPPLISTPKNIVFLF